MQPRTLHTARTQKIFSTVSASNSPYKTLQNNQVLSTRPNHRKYRLSHSQVSKIDKLLPQGLLRWKERRESEMQNKKSPVLRTNEEESGQREEQYQKQEQCERLQQIKQSSSMHKMNYRIKRDNIVRLQSSLSLHVQIISFDLSSIKPPIEQSQQVHSVCSELQQQPQVISFQVHDQHSNNHFRSQFTYHTLSQQLKFVFETLDQLFDYVVDGVEVEAQSRREQKKMLVCFNRAKMRLQITVQFNTNTHTHNNTQIQTPTYNKIKEKIIQLQLLPFAVIEIVENHHHIEDQQKTQLQQKITTLNQQLNLSKEYINSLKQQNQTLKQNLNKYKEEVDKHIAEKQIIIENYDKLSKASQATKQYHFYFAPDQKAKNYSNFTLKNQILKKVKNDLKWDQISSQAPLPKAGRHYFSFLIKDFLPDFMFGIVTLKGKDTVNAFLGLETICLYASKNNCHIYERGKHYKLSVNLKRGDVVFVIVDREKGMIQWVKRRGYGQRQGDKVKLPQCQQDKNKEFSTQKDHNLCSQRGEKTHRQHTEADLPNNPRHRKASQSFTSQILTTHLSMNPPSLPPTNQNQQIQYIHSTKIPQDMLAHELYGYVEIYNVNEPLKLNEKKRNYYV